MAWQSDASCFKHVMIQKREDYWNKKVVGPGTDHIAMAKMICWSCPVRDECLEHALETKEPYGIYGGFTERERRELIRATTIDWEKVS